MKFSKITPAWFFSEVGFPLKLLQIYIRGDAIVILPFIAVLLVIGLFSFRWMVLLFTIFLAFRFLGEMIYWIMQQFGDKKYRPFDFGFTNLDNNAVYILYQLSSLIFGVLFTGLVIYNLQTWK